MLLSHAMRSDDEGLRRSFAQLARLAERVPVLRCALPDDLAAADASAARLAERLIEDLALPASGP